MHREGQQPSGAAPEAPLVLHAFPSFAVGGAQVRFAAVANRLGREWRHCIVAMDGDLGCRERLDPALDVRFQAVEARKRDTLGNVRRFRQVLRAVRPHVLITSNWGTIEWAMANTPALVRQIHTEDGPGPDEQSSQLRRRVWTRRVVLRRPTVVVPSRRLHSVARETWGVEARRLLYVPNGVDLARFTVRADRRACWQVGGPVIGTVAALRPEKNIGRLLRAFACVLAVQDARLVVAGDGPQRPGLMELARQLGIAHRVEFPGHVPDPRNCYTEFDLFALSSDTEQMPFSVLEAMASGLPVAGTEVGDVKGMVAPENRDLIVPPDDVALAGCLRTLVSDPSLARRVGAANRAKAVREFDQERMFATYAELWRGPAFHKPSS